MTNRNTTKRALLTSVLAIFLCLSMFVGTTFAWFTDSVTSAGNKIVSGSLKVDLEVLEENGWVSIKDNPKAIFTYENWEPGYTEVKFLKVVNKGSLALKWKAALVTDQVIGADEVDLAEVIDVYVKEFGENDSPEMPTRDFEGWTKLEGTLRDFINSIETTTTGTLEAKQSDVLGIAFKMQETAGNEYQEMTLGEFDIKILATQLDYEEDSFGKDYDAGLTPPDEDGDILKEENSIQYIYRADGSVYLYKVMEDYADDTVVVPEGVTNFANYAFYYNNNVKNVVLPSTVTDLGRAFDSSSVEKVVLNEGLTTISSRAFKATTNLKEVVFSSTVTTIADNAFQKSGIQSITLPASVTTIGDAAFTASLVEDVTIEGENVFIDHYAFRDCANLKSITILSNTITLGSGMIFTNAQNNNANPNNITIYAVSDEVIQTLKNNADIKCTVLKTTMVSNAAELLSLGGKSLEGAIILTDNIDLGGAAMPTIGAAYGKSLTVIGNGYTISNGTTAHTNHNGMKHHGLFYAYTNSTLTIKDIVIDNVDIDATQDTERNYGAAVVVAFADGGSNVILNNVDVKNCNILNNTPDIGDEAGVYVGYQTGTLTMIDCDSIGCTVAGETTEKTGAFVGMVNGTATLTNCTTDLTIGTCNRVSGTLTEN